MAGFFKTVWGNLKEAAKNIKENLSDGDKSTGLVDAVRDAFRDDSPIRKSSSSSTSTTALIGASPAAAAAARVVAAPVSMAREKAAVEDDGAARALRAAAFLDELADAVWLTNPNVTEKQAQAFAVNLLSGAVNEVEEETLLTFYEDGDSPSATARWFSLDATTGVVNVRINQSGYCPALKIAVEARGSGNDVASVVLAIEGLKKKAMQFAIGSEPITIPINQYIDADTFILRFESDGDIPQGTKISVAPLGSVLPPDPEFVLPAFKRFSSLFRDKTVPLFNLMWR